MKTTNTHPMGVVQRQTGLSSHVIRKWEERYHAVTPERSESGRRLYSSEDIMRLQLLKQAVATGRSIGQVVGLPDETLQAFIDEDRKAAASPNPAIQRLPDDAYAIAESYIDAALAMDDNMLRSVLQRSYVQYGEHTLLDEIIPLIMRSIGDAWHAGTLRIAQEHLATFRIYTFLLRLFDAITLPDTAPVAISATLHDQNHVIGALSAAVIAREGGWRSLFLGGSMPAAEIAGAVRATGTRLLLLSFNYPYDELGMHTDLTLLRDTVGKQAEIVIGGAPVRQFSRKYPDIGIRYLTDFSELRMVLKRLLG